MFINAGIQKFIRGPISLNQLLEFSKFGVNAVRIFLYIRMQEGILVTKELLDKKDHTFIKLDNKSLEEKVGVHK